ncbi:hypothetical protein AB4Z48_37035 [Cupriavidus sp. 2TAF22]|uniref:hypothetical protein n=1 Tax=unclassified Cupriavidus TaxID=2640874 RepID=UPI003F8F2010
MSLELLVLTLDDVLIRADELRYGIDNASQKGGSAHSQQATYRDGCGIRIRAQAAALMHSAEMDGARLALAAPISSRILCGLLDAAIGPDWPDRFTVVATADALSSRETEADLYRLILRTTGVPAHRALLICATQSSLRAAKSIGMHTAAVQPEGSDVPQYEGTTLPNSTGAVWPDFHTLELIANGLSPSHSACRATAVPAVS